MKIKNKNINAQKRDQIWKKIASARPFLPVIFYLLSFIFSPAQSYQELQQLQKEYQKVLEKQALQKPEAISEAEKTAKSTALPDKLIYSRKDVESLLVNTEKLIQEMKALKDSTEIMPYIGYNIFTQRDTVPFWQNLPAPENYQLGPGDEVIISLWGGSNGHEEKTINRDGQIFIDKIGVLSLGGKSINEAKTYIISKYSRIYSTLSGNSPKSYLDITLGELKSVNVHFVGFVNIPGVHLIHPFSNVVTGLTQAGGVDINGSLRQIQVIRNNEVIRVYDLYDYLFYGKSLHDLRLLDQDIVFVPPRNSTIAVTGRIRVPGYYESNNSTNLEETLNLAGKRDARSGSAIFMYRLKNGKSFIINEDDLSRFNVMDGDSIHIPILPEVLMKVSIGGQVKSPGDYPFYKDLTIGQLIDATSSKSDHDFYQSMDLKHIKIHRKNPSGVEPIELTVDAISDSGFQLHNGDQINIPVKRINQPVRSIVITGEIQSPGLYGIGHDTQLKTVVDAASGLTPNAMEKGIEIFRDSLRVGWMDMNFYLQDGDSIHVRTKTGLVRVDGEVNNPGYISYKRGTSVKDYIEMAGGFNAFAETRDVLVIHPNGIAIPKSRWSSPKVLEGSTIIVNPRTVSGSSKGPTGWEAFSIISTQAGNVATTLLTLILLMNQTSGSAGN